MPLGVTGASLAQVSSLRRELQGYSLAERHCTLFRQHHRPNPRSTLMPGLSPSNPDTQGSHPPISPTSHTQRDSDLVGPGPLAQSIFPRNVWNNLASALTTEHLTDCQHHVATCSLKSREMSPHLWTFLGALSPSTSPLYPESQAICPRI